MAAVLGLECTERAWTDVPGVPWTVRLARAEAGERHDYRDAPGFVR